MYRDETKNLVNFSKKKKKNVNWELFTGGVMSFSKIRLSWLSGKESIWLF